MTTESPRHLRAFAVSVAAAMVFLASTDASAQRLLLLTSGATIQGTVDRRDNITTTSESSLSRVQTYEFSYANPLQPGRVQEGSFEAAGQVTYGRMDLGLSTVQTGNVVGPLATVFSSALWRDQLTFVAPSNGTVRLQFQIAGDSTSTRNENGVQSQAIVRFYGGASGPPVFTDYFPTNSALAVRYESAPISFASGVPLQIDGSMGTNLRVFCTGTLDTCSNWSGSGVIGFYAVLSRIQLFDETGAPIVQFSVTSGSGQTYTEGGILPVSSHLTTLANDVLTLNLQAGISNSLDGKLAAVMAALDDANERNDVAAINGLNAFINAVEAQRGKKLTDVQANLLVSNAQLIIRMILAS